MIQENFICPYCWENQSRLFDTSTDNQSFIEDCEVCCNPNKIQYQIHNGKIIIFDISDGNE